MKVLVAGGARSLVYGNLARKLSKQNIQIDWYVSDLDGDPFTGIPPGCEGIIIVRDIISHSLYHKVNEAAKARKTPVAAIPRKWSQGEQILRLQGIIPPPQIPVPVTVPVRDVNCFLDQFITKELANGNPIKLTSVEEAARQELGDNVQVDPQEVALTVAKVTQKMREKAITQPDSKTFPTTEDVHALVDLVAEETPHFFRDVHTLAGYIQESFNITAPTGELAKAEHRRIHVRWRMEPEWRDKCIKNYLLTWMKNVLAEDAVWPSLTEIYERSREIFGVGAPHPVVVDARVQVLGEWARDLSHTEEAKQYLAEKAPVKGLELKTLMAEGKVKSIRSSVQRLTSVLAVQEFLDATYPTLIAPPSQPETVASPLAHPNSKVDDMLTLASLIEDRVMATLQPLVARFADLEARMTALEQKVGQPVPMRLELPDLLRDFKGLEFNFQIRPKTGD